MSAEATLVSHIKALGPHLHESMATAIAQTNPALAAIPHSKHPYLRPLVARAHLRENLEKTQLPLGWTVTGNSRRMGETYLYQPELSARLRVLKERRRSYPGGVPVAGRNPTRRKFWAHPSLPGLGGSGEDGKFIDVANLLLCWDFETEGDLESFQLRVVHTTEPGHYGDAVRCNFRIDIKPGGGIFEHRSFAGSDDPVDFFNIHIDKDENEA